MQAAQAVDPHRGVEVVHDLCEAVGGADVKAGGEQVAGVQADPEAPAPAGKVDQLGQFLEAAAERVAGPRGVLEQQWAGL